MGRASISRRMIDVTQKARGRSATKYEFEIIPYFVGELPSGIEKVLFAWERSNKIFVTEAEPVNPHTRAVFWKQYLKQNVTMYLDNGKPQSKEYSFKIQSVKLDSKGHEEKKTIGKTKVDLASFCTGEVNPVPQEIFLQLKPHGKLKVSIKACWLKDAPVDFDAMTEASGFSKSELTKLSGEDEEEQDLSGFDPEDGEGAFSKEGRSSGHLPSSLGPHRDGSNSPRKGPSPQVTGERKAMNKAAAAAEAPAAAAGKGGGAAAKEQKGAKGKGKGKESELESPKIAAGGRSKLPDEIPGGWQPPLDPEEKARLDEEAREEAERAKQEEYNKMVAEVEAKLRANMEAELAARSSWCCCCPPSRATRTRESTELAAVDSGSLRPVQEEMRR